MPSGRARGFFSRTAAPLPLGFCDILGEDAAEVERRLWELDDCGRKNSQWTGTKTEFGKETMRASPVATKMHTEAWGCGVLEDTLMRTGWLAAQGCVREESPVVRVEKGKEECEESGRNQNGVEGRREEK